jgi:hypothetical protein
MVMSLRQCNGIMTKYDRELQSNTGEYDEAIEPLEEATPTRPADDDADAAADEAPTPPE